MKLTGRKRNIGIFVAVAVLIAVSIAVFFAASRSLGSVSLAADGEGRSLLEQSVRRAAVSCYASEGFYPPDVDYIVSHYGVVVDGSRYAVYYEIFADNIMPEITVVPLG